ncbi:MAG: ATP synthase F1 subunit epsilon [Myxococcota bacterium]
MALEVFIVTPNEEALNIPCEEVVAPGVEGEIGFLPGHIPLISVLKAGVLTVRENGRPRIFAIGTGYVELDDDKVIVLTESCDRPEDIDVAEEERTISETEKELEPLGPADPRFIQLNRTLQLARSRVEAKRRSS